MDKICDKIKLEEAIEDLASANRKQASLWLTFWRGVLYGFGFFVGSALLAAALVYILTLMKSWGAIGNLLAQIADSIKSK